MPSASWTTSAYAENVAFFRRMVAEFVCANGIEEPQLTDVRLVISEAVTNVVMHAFGDRAEPGDVTVTASVTDRDLAIVVRDDGRGMSPRQDSPGSGLGLALIRRIADGFEHRVPPGGGTELRMCFVL